MKRQPNRLATGKEHRFHGRSIDRKAPIRFRLDGQTVDAFAGDTVLSALLAAGIDSVGQHRKSAVALDERMAPAVVPMAHRADPAHALPMDRLPALEGLDLLTLGNNDHRPHAAGLADHIAALFAGPRKSLDLDLTRGLARPWHDLPPDRRIQADLVVVGAGISGLAAARKAADMGERVVVVERRPFIGGDIGYFGTMGEEEKPEKTIERLAAALSRQDKASIMLLTEAFAWFDGGIRVHQVLVHDRRASGHVIDIVAPRVVLATGAIERLPVFGGNRLPGVVGSVAAYHRAHHYGIWRGSKAAFSTGVSAAYRLLMQASDAGIAVARVTDTRIQPESRFIEFSKAYGITLAPGIKIDFVRPVGQAVAVHSGLSFAGPERELPALEVDSLVVSGGFQPDLELWHGRGGQSAWDERLGRLEPQGEIEGVALAGSAAGWTTTGACLMSGTAAAAHLLGRDTEAVSETWVDPIYETPDAPASIGLPSDQIAYLGGGPHLLPSPTLSPPVPKALFGHQVDEAGLSLAEAGTPLAVDELAGAVQSGLIGAHLAGAIASERNVGQINLADAARGFVPTASEAVGMPVYLAGRFGDHAQRWTLASDDKRSFEPGCLIHINSDASDPAEAVGTVIGTSGDGAILALIGHAPLAAGQRLVVRDLSGAVPVHLVALVEEARQAG